MEKIYSAIFNKLKAFIFALSFFLLPAAMLFAQPVVTNTTPGSHTWVCPAGVTSIIVECWGGGGAGGSRFTPGFSGGGGGGAYSMKVISVVPGESYDYYVGAGVGIEVLPSSGDDSWFQTAGTVMAKGGISAANFEPTKGLGGAAIDGVGTTKFSGGDGKDGETPYSGGGGSSAGTGADGTDATINNAGAVAPAGGGNGGSGGTVGKPIANNGSAGVSPGGGGGGALGTDANARIGGAGANGQVRIYYGPTITSFTPGSACLGSTPVVILTGTNFKGATAVRINGISISPFTFVSATEIMFNLPATGITTGPVSVTTPIGTGISATNFIVNTLPSISKQSTATQTKCIGVAATAMSVTASGSDLTYQWYSNVANSNTGGTSMGATNGGQTSTFTPPTNTVGTLYYYVVVSGTCTPAVTSNVSGAIIVNPFPTATINYSATAYCAGPATYAVTQTGQTGGKYSVSPAVGLTVNSSTGLINTLGAITGSYTITYTFSLAGCTNTATTNITIGPVANAGNPLADICEGQSSDILGGSISGTATGGIWTSSAGGTFTPSATDLNATWTPPLGYYGTAILTLTTTGGSCTPNTSDTKPQNVIQSASGTLTPVAPSICPGSNITFTATPGFSLYEFYVIDAITHDTTLVRSASTVNTYNSNTLNDQDTVLVKVFNTNNCAIFFNKAIVTIKPLPEAIITPGNTTICEGDNLTFTATGGTSYTFKIGGIAVETNSTGIFERTDFANGDNVSVDVTNDGCTATSATSIVTVNLSPNGALTATTPISVCPGGDISFSATGGVSYQFLVDGVMRQDWSASATFTYTTTASDNGAVVTVNVAKGANGTGCTKLYTPGISITVNPLPSGTIAITETSGTANDNIICEGDPVTYTFSNAGYQTYVWKINGVVKPGIGNVFTTTEITNINGDVTVDITSSSNCFLKDFAADPVSVITKPAGSLAASTPTTICENTEVIFTATPNVADPTLIYNFKVDGNQVLIGPSHQLVTSALPSGTYPVTVEVTNSNGCTSIYSVTMTVNAAPTGIFTMTETSGATNNDGTICAGDAVTFTVPGAYAKYNFIVNDVSIIESTNPTYTTSTLPNNAVVKVAVTAIGSGCVGFLDNSFTITVNPLPAVATITGPDEVCANTTIPLLITTTGGTWSSSDELKATVDATGLVTGKSAGTVEIYYTVLDGGTNCNNKATKTIIVNAVPIIAPITGDLNVCVEKTTALSNVTGGGVWSSDDPGIATVDGSGNVTGVTDGTANISYTVTNDNNCITAKTVVMNVHALPVVAAIAGRLDVCVNSTTALTSSPTGGTWSSSDPSIATVDATSGVVTGVAFGQVVISYTVTSTYSCVTAVTENVSVNGLPVPTLEGPKLICQGATDTYTTEESKFNYNWNIVGGTINSGGQSTDNTVEVYWDGLVAKSISVNYEDINGCSGKTFATVLNAPGSSPIVTGSTEVCLNISATYTTQSGNNNYDWSVSEGGSITAGGTATDNTATILWTSVGNHSVKVNYALPGGCSAASPTIYAVAVKPLPTATITVNNSIVCQSGTNPTITFKGAGSVAPYTFTYQVNSDPTQTVVSTGNNKTVSVPTGTSGTFTYTLISVQDASSTACSQDQSGSVTITVAPTPSAEISYSASPICKSSGLISVSRTGSPGGTYSALPAGLTIDGTTGEINPSASVAGNYIVTYTVASAGGCAAYSTTTPVTITAIPAATISYNGTPFCTTASPVDVTRTGSIGGTYSSTTGLTIDGSTGQITPSSSTPGNYTITYTIVAAGGCAEFTTTANVTITVAPAATIDYSGSPYCIGTGTANVTRTGSAGGFYTALPSGLSIDGGTGAINLAASVEGTYTVTYSIGDAGGCAAISTQATVVINAPPTAVAGSAPVLTCANSGAVNITAGADATNYSTILWTSSGTGDFTDANSLTAATYTPGPADTVAKFVTLTLRANGNGGCGFVISTKTLKINPVPRPFIITPSSVQMCSDNVRALSASVSPPGSFHQTWYSASPYENLPIPDTSSTGAGAESIINVSGIPAGAIVTGGWITFNITHGYDEDLVLNLKGPNGNILNVVNQRGGNGENFTNTRLVTGSPIPIPTSGTDAPFSAIPYGSSNKIGVGPTGYKSNAVSWHYLLGVPNGDWKFIAQDVVGCRGVGDQCATGYGTYHAGMLKDWSITIYYDVPVDPVNVTWSPTTDLYEDLGLVTPYTDQVLSTVYINPQAAGTKTYTATNTNEFGCSSMKTVQVVTNQTPTVSISADYCIVPGKIQLTANSNPAATSYIWSNGETSQIINVDLAGEYDVTVFTANSCPGTGTISVANNLVTNGDFESGNFGFTLPPLAGNKYQFQPNVPGNTELTSAGYYGVGTDAQEYNPAFWGHDHTAGSGKFMIVNGFSNANPQPIIWQQTVSVIPNTEYYFSAWALSLNKTAPFAKLALTVNGTVLSGATNNITLPAGVNSNSNNGWTRIYGTMTTGPSTTTAVLSVTNTQTAAGNSRFGLDDISFSSLSTFVNLESVPGSDAQVACKSMPIENIVYRAGNGQPGGPVVTGLPPGVTDLFAGDKLTISGTPTKAGNYTYKIKTTGCNPVTVTGTINVQEDTLKLTSGSNTALCMGVAMADIVYTWSGTATDATVTGLPAGLVTTKDPVAKTITISGIPTTTVGSPFTYSVTTISSCGTAGAVTESGTITVQEQTLELTSGPSTPYQTVCIYSAIENIVYTAGGKTTGASFHWIPYMPSGVTATFSGGLAIIKGTPTEAGTFDYSVTTSGTSCKPFTVSGSITVNPAASLVLTTGNNSQIVCAGQPIADIKYNVNGATDASITSGNLPPEITGSYDAVNGVFTISGTPVTGGTYSYTITATGGCTTATATGTITVNAQIITLTSGSPSPSVCQNAPMAPIVYTYSGQATGATVSILPANGMNYSILGKVITISGTPTSAGPIQYSITTTGTCGLPVTVSGTITVQPGPISGTIANVSICSGENGALILVGHSGTILRWEYMDLGGTLWTSTGSNAITQGFPNLTLPRYYRAVVNKTGCVQVTSNIATVGIHNYWTGTISTDWNTAGNWSDNAIASTICPTTYIPNMGHQPVINANTLNIGSLIIDEEASLTIQSGGIIHIAGSITKHPTALFDAENGTVEFNGSTAQIVSGNTFKNNTIGNLVVSNGNTTAGLSLTTTAGETLNISGTLSFGTSTTTADFRTNDNLTLKSTAANTATVAKITGSNKITGNVTVERYLPVSKKAWYLLSPNTLGTTISAAWQEGVQTKVPGDVKNPNPGYGININGQMGDWVDHGFDQPIATLPSMKYYNYATNSYPGVLSTIAAGSFNEKLGYFVFVRGDRGVVSPTQGRTPTTLRSKGLLFQPSVPPASLTGLPHDEWMIVGNPYASAIDFFKLNAPGIQQTYTIWDPSGHNPFNTGIFREITKDLNGDRIVTPSGGIYSKNNIPDIQSGQAFLVQAQPNATGAIHFSENDKVIGSTNAPYFAKSKVQPSAKLWATLYSTKAGRQLADGVLSMYADEYSNDYDRWDAEKMPNSSENMGIASNGRILAIERRQMPTENDTVQYNMDDWRIQNYEFAFTTEHMQGIGVQPYLNDRYLDKQTLLSLNDTTWVDFSIINVPGSWALNRFYVTFKPTGTLPVTVLDLTATPKNANVEVLWKTENEMNVKEYEVERSSDARLFKKVATSPSTQKGGDIYKWLDENAVMGWNYYRIRTIDNDGKFTLSSVVKAYVQTKPGLITVAPNPVIDGKINLYLKNEVPGTYWVRLLNALGQPMLSKKISHEGGTNSYIINSDFKIAKEIYQLEVTKPDGSIQVIKVVF